MDKVLGSILEHVDENTYFFMIADHGIKPLRYDEPPHAHMDHGGTTPVIAKHDYDDGDEVPGVFIAMGPGIRKGVQLMGLPFSVYDVAPTVLNVYGIKPPKSMHGRVINEIFTSAPAAVTAKTGN
jgi:arylsulfatase A-like enzyme